MANERWPTWQRVADDYDQMASRYAEFVAHTLDRLPLDRAIIRSFAERVLADSRPGPVADLGSGSGYLTDHLARLGIDSFGLDVSESLLSIAQATYPRLGFVRASMTDLPLNDSCLCAAVAWYSLIHLSEPDLAAACREFARVIRPGGSLLVAYFTTSANQPLVFDHAIAPALCWPMGLLTEFLVQAGFCHRASLVRQPRPDERFLRAHSIFTRG